MSGVTWWSASKKEDVEISTMSLPHARNTLAKLERGEATNSEGERLPFAAECVVRDALEKRILDIEAERMADAEADAADMIERGQA